MELTTIEKIDREIGYHHAISDVLSIIISIITIEELEAIDKLRNNYTGEIR